MDTLKRSLNKNSTMQLFSAFVGMMLLSCSNRADNTIYLIPKGYEGPVLIVFNQSDGVPPKYENGKRVYKIPLNGILKTQLNPNYGVHETDEYYYVDSLENKTDTLPYFTAVDWGKVDPASDKIVVSNSETGKQHGKTKEDIISYEIFAIAKIKDADSIGNLRDAFPSKVLRK